MEKIIAKTIDFVQEKLHNAEAGHDWFHIQRVWNTAKYINRIEKGNPIVVELSALLHDIADSKFHNGDESLALEISENYLKQISVSKSIIDEVLFIIKHISFKNRHETSENISLELKIVQDADRLDAIGAIGIARTFHFGGFRNSLLYDPSQPPRLGMSKEEYKKSNGTTINHFYEKLLFLKDMMNTATGKYLAQERHDFMLKFLEQFYKEWEGR